MTFTDAALAVSVVGVLGDIPTAIQLFIVLGACVALGGFACVVLLAFVHVLIGAMSK